MPATSFARQLSPASLQESLQKGGWLLPGQGLPLPWQVPAPLQVSAAPVQKKPSVQGVPLPLGGFEHRPVPGLHVPASWHWSSGAQTTGVPPHVPLVHWSPLVQRAPSLHGVPFGLVDVSTQPVSGSAVVLSGLASQTPVEHWLLQTASLGVLVHAMAGDLAAQDGGERGLLASDLFPFLRGLINQ